MALQKLGRYEILGELGKGAMGIVYLARDPLIGRQLAIKTFNVSLSAGDKELELFRARFLREAQSAGILSHPNIVTIHDVMAGEGGAVFIAMEYVKGTDLKLLMQRQVQLDPRFVVEVVAQIADGLDYAHGKGVIHRDIKPANIILTQEKQAKITDFGIAHLDASNLTTEGQILGTPNYMSPEMIRGQPVDHRADIFSLGVMLYEMLTRQKPFSGQNLSTVTHKIVSEPFIPPDQLVPGLSQGLVSVLDRALAKDPEQRYGKAGEMAADLRAVYAPKAAPASLSATGSFLLGDEIRPGTPAPGDDAGRPSASAPEVGTATTPAPTQVRGAPAAGPPAAGLPGGTLDASGSPAVRTPDRKAAPALWIASALVLVLAVAGILILALRDRGADGSGGAEPGRPAPRRPEGFDPAAQAGAAAGIAGEEPEADPAERGPVERGLAEARRALAERDYRRAIERAEEVLELEPQNPSARELLADAREGQRRRDQVRERFSDAGRPPAPTAGGGESAGPAAAPDAGKGTLAIEFLSEMAEGRVTIYAGQEMIFQESFEFGKKRSRFRRSPPVSGRLTARRELPAGEVTLRIYVTLKDPPQTKTAEVDLDLPAGGSATLAVSLSPQGRLRAGIAPAG